MAISPDIFPFFGLDNQEFDLLLFELQNGLIYYDADKLNCLHFNPFLQGNDFLTLSSDLDPDSNMFSYSIDYNYYVEDQFNNFVNSKINSKSSFSVMHVNSCSLMCNLHKLTNLLLSLEFQFSVLGVTETWLNDCCSAQLVDVDNYDFISKCRPNSHGGGVGLYVLNNQEFKLRDDLEVIDIDFAETLFIEIRKPRGRNIIVRVIYRPPDRNLDLFLQQFKELMLKISRENKICYLMGDFNFSLEGNGNRIFIFALFGEIF